MKKIFLIIFALLTLVLNVHANENIELEILQSQLGRVTNIEYIDLTDNDTVQTKQNVEVELLKGNLKGSKVLVENILSGNPYYDIKLKEGKKVILHVEDDGDGLNFSIADVYRAPILWWLSLLFCGLLIYVGKKKGIYSLVSIVFTCGLIYFCLSPLILHSVNPIVATVIICLISTAITMYLVGGFNKKSTSATLGCILSLVFAGLLSYISVKAASLTGFSNENCMFLFSAHPELDFVGIAISSIIIATLGAVMDVGMSIASTINEIYTLDNSKTIKELFNSGMNVGRDIIGTMANTLILVYFGGSLPLILLSSNIDWQKFVNLNQVITEIVAALIGSSAIIICVPITAIVTAKLIKK